MAATAGRVLVTGAAGFIGAAVVRQLVSQGAEVVAAIRPGSDGKRLAQLEGVRSVELDVLAADPAPLVAEIAPALCLHLAWYVEPGKYLDSAENVRWLDASLRLLRALDAAGCARTVIAGTCFEHDLTGTAPLSEQSSIRPRTLYAACKHALCVVAAEQQRLAGRSFAWGRIFYQYGPGEHARRLVPYVTRTLLAGQRCPLTAGTQVRDFLHVDDVGSALVAIGKSDVEGAVNIGSGQAVTVAEVARSVGRATGGEHLLALGEQPMPVGDPAHVVADATRLRALGWRPRWSLDEGIADSVTWWRARA